MFYCAKLTTFMERMGFFTAQYCISNRITVVIICDKVHAHGRPQGGQNGHLPPLEIGTKKQKFL